MSPRGRATARVYEEAISHVPSGPPGSAEALLDYDSEESLDLLVQGVSGAPRDVTASEERPVADVLTFDDHEKSCETCRKAKHSRKGRGLVRLTRTEFAQRSATWRLLCPEGKQFFTEGWVALGLGMPDYARELA